LYLAWLIPALAGAAGRPSYPPARVDSVKETFFGTDVSDPYRWLESAGAPEVRTWVQSENALARPILDEYPDRDKLKEDLTPLTRLDKISGVQARGGRIFYERTSPEKEQPQLCWRDLKGGPEVVAVDFNMVASSGVAAGAWYPSRDGKWLLYATHPNNGVIGTLHMWNVATNSEIAAEQLPWADYADVSWDAASAGFYYTKLPVSSRVPVADYPGFCVIAYHPLGADPARDAEIFPASGNPGVYLKPEASPDGRWLFVSAIEGWTSTKIFFRENQPNAKFRPLFESEGSVNSVVTLRDKVFVLTNEGAPHGKIVEADMKPGHDPDWSTILPESKESSIQSMRVLGNHLVLLYTRDASSHLAIYETDGSGLKYVSLPVSGSVEDLTGSPDDDTAYFSFESFAVPLEVRQLSISTGETTVWFRTKLPLNFNKIGVDFKSAISKDGQPVSMYLLRRTDFDPKKRIPILFKGYGGFGTPLEPRFSPEIVALIDRGWGVAIVHCRGGGEYGEAWHRGGMLTKKQNTFNDMFAAADYLIAERIADRKRLAIEGASNGGLLVAAAVVQRPTFFRVAIARSAITDMIRFPTCGEGKTWISEYGSPSDERQFNALYAYSPYHWVEKGTSYPSMLFIAGANDARVCAWHSWKMAAALQAASSSDHPILMVTDQGGHRGMSGATAELSEIVDRVSFLLDQDPPAAP
jgi:prolyl oligopeptidase